MLRELQTGGKDDAGGDDGGGDAAVSVAWRCDSLPAINTTPHTGSQVAGSTGFWILEAGGRVIAIAGSGILCPRKIAGDCAPWDNVVFIPSHSRSSRADIRRRLCHYSLRDTSLLVVASSESILDYFF